MPARTIRHENHNTTFTDTKRNRPMRNKQDWAKLLSNTGIL